MSIIKHILCCRCFIKNDTYAEKYKIPCDENDGIPCECNINKVKETMVEIPLD